MTGYVYAIQSGDAIKLGFSKHPWRRLGELNVHNPDAYKLLGFAHGTPEHERELHMLCAAERIRGEWFRRGRVVSLFLDHLPPPSGRRRPIGLRKYAGSKLAEYIAANTKTVSAFAAQIGVNTSAITRVLKGERRPSYDLMVKISEATGGAVSLNDIGGIPLSGSTVQ